MKPNRWPTLQELKNSACAPLNSHLLGEENKSPKPSKFGNKKTEIDNILFDSEKEANRYKELKLLLKVGKIAFLELQVPYELNAGGTHSFKYVADFKYWSVDLNDWVVEDSKGFETALFKKKARLMRKVHGIEIKIT